VHTPIPGCDPSCDPADCDDGDACTVDQCDPLSGCSWIPLDCDDGDPCTLDACDAVAGCVYQTIPDCP
jgi:hypothetical protein